MITFYGRSDDLVEVEGCTGADEFYAADVSIAGAEACWKADLVAPATWAREQMRVRAIYDGCWSFAVGQVDEDLPMPAWALTLTTHESGHSVELRIDAPEGTRLTNIWPPQGDA
jgi:hypothetical protein